MGEGWGEGGVTNIDAASHVPPVVTKTWFHTGVYIDRNHISNYFAGLIDVKDRGEYYREPGMTDAQARELLLDDTVFPGALTDEEEREACRALNGSMLRQEIYALDGTDKEAHPYSVTEQNFTIRRIQPEGTNRYAVFFAHPRESIGYHYERVPGDHRIAHSFTLEVDEFGNVLKSAAVGYDRRQVYYIERSFEFRDALGGLAPDVARPVVRGRATGEGGRRDAHGSGGVGAGAVRGPRLQGRAAVDRRRARAPCWRLPAGLCAAGAVPRLWLPARGHSRGRRPAGDHQGRRLLPILYLPPAAIGDRAGPDGAARHAVRRAVPVHQRRNPQSLGDLEAAVSRCLRALHGRPPGSRPRRGGRLLGRGAAAGGHGPERAIGPSAQHRGSAPVGRAVQRGPPAGAGAVPGSPGAPLDLDAWPREHGIKVSARKSWKGGRLFTLEECPFTTAHKDGAFLIQFENGSIHAGCHHAGCGGGRQRWQELRRMHEPEYADRERSSPPPRDYALTDAGNGERLVARFGDDIRYCSTNASWYIWNGALWEKDTSNRMYLLATRVARSIYDESRDAPTPDQAKSLARWAITSENLRTRKAMIESATPLAAVELDAFDAREYLLNCRNGTLELDTLTFREHQREDLLTRSCGVAYDPSAGCPQWNAPLDLIFDQDAEYISGFQAMCGYSLLQTNPEQLLFILFGKGKNGKSKTIEVLAAILGDYAVNIAAESLMVHRYEGVRSDLARIAGARMATASEGEDGARLAESIIKQLTGEYAITVGRLYENEFEFTPTAKIWLTTNHEPVIRGTDEGIWRRIWMVPFTVQIPEEKRDPEIEKKLIAEGVEDHNYEAGKKMKEFILRRPFAF